VIASKITHPCPGQTNGGIEITTTGGTGTLTYAWTGGATTQNLSNVGSGSYNVTVKDANGKYSYSTECYRTFPINGYSAADRNLQEVIIMVLSL
jgi:hypothetical protein